MMNARTLLLSASLACFMGTGALAGETPSTDSDRAMSAELLADSSARASALEAPPADLPKISGNLLFRYYGNFGSDKLPAGSKDFANGFQTRRVRVSVQGQIWNPNLTYRIDYENNRADGAAALQEAFGDYKFDNGFSLRWGQFKAPLLKEELVSHTLQLATERSTVNSIFSATYTQGVCGTYAMDAWRFMGMFSDGLKALNTDYDNGGSVPGGEADYALTGRAEYKFAGEWKNFDQFTSFRNSPFVGMVGGAIHWQDGGSTFASTGSGATTNISVLEYTADAMVKGNGWNAFAEFVGRHAKDQTTPTEATYDDFGFVVQGGYFFTNELEGFARYDVVAPDKDRTNHSVFHEITIGGNYYFIPESQAAKFTLDLLICPSKQSKSSSLVATNTASGLLAADKSQFVLRAQMQLLY
jgi:phosphate-selective porin